MILRESPRKSQRNCLRNLTLFHWYKMLLYRPIAGENVAGTSLKYLQFTQNQENNFYLSPFTYSIFITILTMNNI